MGRENSGQGGRWGPTTYPLCQKMGGPFCFRLACHPETPVIEPCLGVGSVFVVNSTAPSVLRPLMAAGTPVFCTNLYHSWPKLFRPLIPRSACGIDVVPRASPLAPTMRNGGPSAPARFDHASQDFRGERVNRWANPTKKNDLAPTKPLLCGRADGRLASYNNGDSLDIVQVR